jgi:hypothetical protein
MGEEGGDVVIRERKSLLQRTCLFRLTAALIMNLWYLKDIPPKKSILYVGKVRPNNSF